MYRLLALLISVLLLSSSLLATTLERGVSPAIRHENYPAFKEIYRIKVENRVDGVIAVSEDSGKNWANVGKVLYPVTRVSKTGYAAARWISEGRVAAAAVNAIHIKTGAAEWDKSIFTLLPKDFLQPPKVYNSFLSPDSSIYTDIPAGKSIFGGGFAPFVGNIVMLSAPAQPVIDLPRDYVPAVGDAYYILVDRPIDYPKEIIFENRSGGRIIINYYSGDHRVIGEVLRPVVGIGRFPGSLYADPGRIRANHAWVIDISTSPIGAIGGFQIVPALHSSDMGYVNTSTQWMVIGPVEAEEKSLEGMAPFFKNYIHPAYVPEDLEDEAWYEKLLDRFLVQVLYDGEVEWKPMPVFEVHDFYLQRKLPDWANKALANVSVFRILFPIKDLGAN